jgi:hypothetical protein
MQPSRPGGSREPIGVAAGQPPGGKVTIMNAPLGPDSARPSTYTVTGGLELLDEWSADATQSQKNIVHRVIFSVADKTVFNDFDVIDDVENHMEFFVLAKNDLAVKIRIEDLDSFAILYVGPSCDAPGLDPASPPATSQVSDTQPVAEAEQQDMRLM